VFQQYFQQKNMNPFSSSLETPVKELMDLNMKAFQSFSYLMPNELLSMRRPDEMMEKNLEVLIENSHTALAYMQNMFDIMEKHWLKNFETTLKNSRDLSGQTISSSHSVKATSTEGAKKTSKSSSSKTKLTATKAKPSSSKLSTKSTSSKSVAAKAKTSTAPKTVATKPTSTVKKQATQHISPSSSKSSMASSSRPQGTTTEVKHGGSAPHHLSSTSSQSKPMTKELDTHKKI